MSSLRSFSYDSSAANRNLIVSSENNNIRLELRRPNKMDSVTFPLVTFKRMMDDFSGYSLAYILAKGTMPPATHNSATYTACHEMALDAEDCYVINDYIGESGFCV